MQPLAAAVEYGVSPVESVVLAMAKNHPQGKSLLQALKKNFAVTESSENL